MCTEGSVAKAADRQGPPLAGPESSGCGCSLAQTTFLRSPPARRLHAQQSPAQVPPAKRSFPAASSQRPSFVFGGSLRARTAQPSLCCLNSVTPSVEVGTGVMEQELRETLVQRWQDENSALHWRQAVDPGCGRSSYRGPGKRGRRQGCQGPVKDRDPLQNSKKEPQHVW